MQRVGIETPWPAEQSDDLTMLVVQYHKHD